MAFILGESYVLDTAGDKESCILLWSMEKALLSISYLLCTAFKAVYAFRRLRFVI